jgi:hypothetical protein
MATNINTGHNGSGRKARVGRKPTNRTPAPVTITKHDPRALKVAQELAAGRDVRVVGNPDGTVSIINGK